MKRSTVYRHYREHERDEVVAEVGAQRIKHSIDAEPYLGYWMVLARLRRQGTPVHRKAVQRVMQIKRRQAIVA